MTDVATRVPLTPDEQAGVEIALTEQVSPSAAAQMADVGGPHFNQEILFTLLIILFALVSLLFLYLAAKEGKATPFFLRIYLITIIVFGTLAIVASAYTTEQIAPVVGLFGTIAGYVLGRSERPNESQQEPDRPPRAPSAAGAAAAAADAAGGAAR